jgi:hypothetical protein
MSCRRPSLSGEASSHLGGVVSEIQAVEIPVPRRCGTSLQLGLSMLRTSNASRRKFFRLFLTYRLPACAYDLLTPFLFNKIPGYYA